MVLKDSEGNLLKTRWGVKRNPMRIFEGN